VLPFQYELSARTKCTVRLVSRWSAAIVVLSTLAYAFNSAVVGASTNSLTSPEVIVVSPGATAHPLLIANGRYDALEGCLTAWGYISAQRPEIYAAGLEQFLGTGCGTPR
jgi:hypothetical protein